MNRTVATLGGLALATGTLVVLHPGDTTATGRPTAAARPAAATSPDPSRFTNPRPNPWFPLRPGLTTRLRGSEDGEHFRERVVVMSRTKTIQGVRTRVVLDVVRRHDGTLAEKTRDWYAADDLGNVWYFGEKTATYDERGHLESQEGSWQAGRHGAVAGIIMPANPHATDAYRQEYWRDHAEDQAWIVHRGERHRVPAGRFRRVVRSYEWSRLEPGVLSLKLYAPGVGILKERDVSGGNERFVLVSVHR
jgi:hypothetical protein